MLLAAAAASSEPRRLEGSGRVTALPGWRLTPNHHFFARAAEQGFFADRSSKGGPQVTGTFSYVADESIEACIDLFGGGEQLHLSGVGEITSVTYGALLGARFQAPGLLTDALVPYVGLLVGPALVYVAREGFAPDERLVTAYAAAAGLTYRLGERFGLTLEYKLMHARGVVPEISGVNGGGHLFALGFTTYFPSDEPADSPFR